MVAVFRMEEMVIQSKQVIFMKKYLQVNGAKQGLIIESTDFNNPVLLFVHGGPGSPIYPVMKARNIKLHTLFTVCYWDQRGTGMSYVAKNKQESISMDQLVEDAKEVSDYLKKEFNQEKIYLMAHSWGTLVGSLAANKYPELYLAYFGIGQIGYSTDSEKETYQFILNQAKAENNKKAINEIEKVKFDSDYYKNQFYNVIRGRYVNKYRGGFLRNGYSIFQNLRDVFTNKGYTLKERLNIIRGGFVSYQYLGEDMAKTDLTKYVKRLDIPVFIFHGKHDYLTSHKEARRFYQLLDAPYKRFFTFERSAHTPFVEEPELFMKLIEEEVLGLG